MRRSLVAVFGVLSMVAGGVGTASADPPGSRWMNSTPTNAPSVRLLGGSGAAVLYELRIPDSAAPTSSWFKPADGAAVRLDPAVRALAGSTLYSRPPGTDVISYRQPPSAAPRLCSVLEEDTVAYTAHGWVQQQYGSHSYQFVTVGANGCSHRSLVTIPNSRLVAADETGFAVEVTTRRDNGGVHDLRYVPFDDPANSVLAYTDEWVYNYVSMSAGAIAWARNGDDLETPAAEVYRWSPAGGSDPVVTVPYWIESTAVNAEATAFAGCATFGGPAATCVAASIPAGGGAVSAVTGAGSVTDDDTSLYLSRFGAGKGIERGPSFADPTRLTRVADIPLLPPVTAAIALGSSRAAYVDSDGPDGPNVSSRSLHWRFAAKTGTGITLLAPIRGGEDVFRISVDGRRQLVGRQGPPDGGSIVLRTEGERDITVFRDVPGQAVYTGTPIEISGTRALWMRNEYTSDPCDPPGCPYYENSSAMLYDVRTGISTRLGEAKTTKWALWGSYVVWASRDGSIFRRDLSSNKTALVKTKGYGVVGLGLWGSYVGWSECTGSPPCYTGRVGYRNMATGAAAVHVVTPGPVAPVVRMTGGHLLFAYGDLPGNGVPHLRELRLGTTVTAPIADASGERDGSGWDAHDEVLAWRTPDEQRAMIAPNSAYVDPPKYLGNALGSASFNRNGGAWTPEFPVSKALPVCQVVIRSKVTGSVLRRLPCAASTGSARASWDGRLTTGRLVPPGSYSWTLTGSDSDGALRWWTGSTAPIAGSVQVG